MLKSLYSITHYVKSPIFVQKLVLDKSTFMKIAQNVAFEFWRFSPIFVQLKVTCLVTLFDRKLQVFKNSPKWSIFGIFH